MREIFANIEMNAKAFEKAFIGSTRVVWIVWIELWENFSTGRKRSWTLLGDDENTLSSNINLEYIGKNSNFSKKFIFP